MELNREDLIWLAGLSEGEACFDIQGKKYPRMRIGMTDRDVVGRAATLMGCKVRLSYQPAPNAAMWHAEIQGAKAVDLMEQLLPFMGERRSRKIATMCGQYRLARQEDRSSSPGPKITRPPALPLLVAAA